MTTAHIQNAGETAVATDGAPQHTASRRRGARRVLLALAAVILLLGAVAASVFGYLTIGRT
jgi:hypothetical protein